MPSPADVLPHRATSARIMAAQIRNMLPSPTRPVVINTANVPLALVVPTVPTDESATATTPTNDVSTLGSASANQRIVRFDTISNRAHIKNVVCNVLFRNIKFIACKGDLMYSTDKNLIAQIILTTISIPDSANVGATCWDQIRHRIPEYLNRKRTTTTNALKSRFEGKPEHDTTNIDTYTANIMQHTRLYCKIRSL